MDTAVVTSSLQSFHVPTASSDSHLSVPHHSSSASSEEDVQSTSALLQDLDRSSVLSFPNYAQSSVPRTVHSQAALTPRYDARKGKSSFSQMFIGPGSDNRSPELTSAAADGIAMTNKDCTTSSLSHQIGASPGGNLEGHRILSDPLSCFVNCGSSGGMSSIVKIETAFPEALQDTSGSQHFHSLEQCTDHANTQRKSPIAYQSVSSAQQMPGIAILMPENQTLPGVSTNHSSGGRGQPSVKAQIQEDRKSDIPPAPPPPPKKPLSPYMRFSKGIWQQVKAANPGLSVCEVGAAIGRIWRELSDTDKQHYIDEFTTDKARYDGEFQNYLRVTGLQASDLIKPRGKKKETKEKHSISRSARQPESQDVSSFAPPDQERSAEQPQRQSNEMSMGVANGQQNTAFFVNHPDGANGEGVSSLPPFSQVWSNSEFLTGQDLLAQMVLSGQHRQQQLVESSAARISLDGNAQQLTKSCSNHTMIAGHEQQAAVQRLSAPVNCIATGTAPGQSDVGAKGWPWPQVSVSLQSSQGVEQSNEGVLVYQLPTSSSWPMSNISASANQSDQNGSLVVRNEAELSMMSAIQAQHGGTAPDGVNCVFQMAPSAVCTTDDAGKHGIVVDQEKLQLRNALLEKSEEVLRLMKELEQVYRLIHQLKEQNDFFHQQWNLHHNNHSSTAKSSGEVDGGGTSTRGT